MVLSLITGRLTLGATVVLAARAALPAPFPVLTRRTFLTTPRSQFPVAKTSEGTATTSKKAASTSVSNEAAFPSKPSRPAEGGVDEGTKAKRGRPAGIGKGGKPKVLIPREDLPPKRAPGPYILFFRSYLMGQPKPANTAERRNNILRASEVWASLSMAEKQPFFDEHRDMSEQYYNNKEEYRRNTPASTLKLINKSRKARGKPKIRIRLVDTVRQPKNAFVWFMDEFRQSPEAKAIMNEAVAGKSYLPAVTKAGAERWRSMSADEKAPYFEMSKKSQEDYMAEKAEATTA
ncbi:hypothetical protein BU15DRAFT_61655 [Melanogaster broomeanus]|nr:hypothetical protein BU15DRAFT_61655 [Melanogaster broomeanus]